MRKLIMFNLISLDGFFAGEDGNIDWHHVDDEFNDFAVEQTPTFTTILFGRTTYELFEPFWSEVAETGKFPGSDEPASAEDVTIGKAIHNAEKYVFSKSLRDVSWKNTKLRHEIDADEIKQLKKHGGEGVICILGSGTIVQALAKLDLIDEYRVLVNPVILGKGKALFKGVENKKLTLLSTRPFRNGNVLITYTPEQK